MSLSLTNQPPRFRAKTTGEGKSAALKITGDFFAEAESARSTWKLAKASCRAQIRCFILATALRKSAETI